MFRCSFDSACVFIAALACLSCPTDSAPYHLTILEEQESLQFDELIAWDQTFKRDERAAVSGSGSGSGSGGWSAGGSGGGSGSGSGYGLNPPTRKPHQRPTRPEFTQTDTSHINIPPTPIHINRLHVTSAVTARFAKTVVTCHVVNPANQSHEVNFYTELPTEAFISGFLIVTGGKVYNSTVDEKEKAQKAYDHAKSHGQTAGQVKQTSEKRNDFTISINVEGGTALSFNLTYEELLKRKDGYFENPIFISPGQKVQHLMVDVHINEPQGLDESKMDFFLERPTSRGNNGEVVRPQWAEMKQLHRDRVHVQFHPNKEEQELVSLEGILGKFVVRYDVIHGQNAGKIEIVNGYFVHHFSPEGFLPMRKNVVFVLDTSGSMSGFKEQQVKEAMATILPDLREQDNFGIVFFESRTKAWREQLLPADKSNIESAQVAVRNIRSGGGTNLYGGIMDSIRLLENAESNDLSTTTAFSLIIMLTDGQPSSGELTDPERIKTAIHGKLEGRYSLFCLGFGEYVNYPFLEQLSLQNRGLARKIYEDADAGLQLVGFYNEVATPLLSNIKITYEDNLVEINSISQTLFPSYFSGTELVVAGKLAVRDDLPDILTCVVTADTEDSQIQLHLETNVKDESESMLSPHAVDNFAQRLWAFLTIKELLSKRVAADGRTEKAALTARALELSLKYHFVTPLTSLIVVKPLEDTLDDLELLPPVSAHETLSHTIPVSSGPSGRQYVAKTNPVGRLAPLGPVALPKPVGLPGPVGQVGPGGQHLPVGPPQFDISVDSDPHFMVHDTQNNVTVCFDIMGTPGDVISLVHDPITGIDINGHVASAYQDYELSTMLTPTIFDSLTMSLAGHQILISADIVIIGQTPMKWGTDWDVSLGNGLYVGARDQKYLTVQFGKDITLVVYRHDVERHHRHKVDYFGLYIEEGKGFSQQVHGIIGQFEGREIRLDRHSVTVDEDNQTKGYIKANDRLIEAIQGARRNLLTDKVVTCWYVDDDAYGLIDGKLVDYVVNK